MLERATALKTFFHTITITKHMKHKYTAQFARLYKPTQALLLEQLRAIRDSDQLISVNGDGCHVLQTLQGDTSGECEESPSDLAERLRSQPSAYDQLDRIIDSISCLHTEEISSEDIAREQGWGTN